MNPRLPTPTRAIAVATLMSLLTACGGGGGGASPAPPPSSSPPPPPTFHATAGLAEKGPLITGSAVTAQELNASLSPTGKQYSYQISSDLGVFSPSSDFTSQYIGVSATGYYFDEVLGTVSAGPLTLNSYSDLSTDTVMNVNILTTLAYQRIQNLVQGGKAFADARAQAEQEVLTALGVPAGSYGRFGSLKLAGNNEGAQILAAISSLFVQGNTSGQVSVLINNFQADIGSDGTLDNAQTRLALETAATQLNPYLVAQNLNLRYGSAGVSFNAEDIARWIGAELYGDSHEFHFPVTDASPTTLFTLPSYVVANMTGKEIHGTTLYVNGDKVTSATVHAGDTIAMRPEAFVNGVAEAHIGMGVFDRKVVAVFLQPAESIDVTPKDRHVGVNADQAYVAQVHFRDGQVTNLAGLDVKWTSGDPAVAASEGLGPVFTAKALGTTTITVSFGALTGGTSLHVVDVALQDFAFSNSPVDTGVGIAQAVKLTGTYTNDSIVDVTHLAAWSSDAPLVATVSDTGVVTGVALGSTTIKATIDSITRTLAVNVTAAGVAVGDPMRYTRRSHSATLLASGKLLVAGGESEESARSAELYDPATGKWSSAGTIPNRHGGHAVAVLQDGKVLIAGGVGSAPAMSFVEIYDPATNQWSAARSMPLEVHGLTATTLQNGKVLVTGGYGDLGPIYANASLYDPAGNTWAGAASLGYARAYHTATLLPDGKVLVTGGFNTVGTAAQTIITPTAELYDPASNSWTPLASMSHARYGHKATLLGDGRLLVTGGFDKTDVQGAEIYDPQTNTWSAAGTMAHPRLWHSATLLANGSVMVAGGMIDAVGDVTDSVEIYDPATNGWSPGAPLKMARGSHTATRLGNNAVLIVGGSNETAPYIHDTTELIW